MESIIYELKDIKFSIVHQSDNVESNMRQDTLKVDHLVSQLNAIKSFSDELERKVQNILALVMLSL